MTISQVIALNVFYFPYKIRRNTKANRVTVAKYQRYTMETQSSWNACDLNNNKKKIHNKIRSSIKTLTWILISIFFLWFSFSFLLWEDMWEDRRMSRRETRKSRAASKCAELAVSNIKLSQVKHWDRNAAPQAGNVWRLKVQNCPGFASDSFRSETGRLMWSYRVLTGSVWTLLSVKRYIHEDKGIHTSMQKQYHNHVLLFLPQKWWAHRKQRWWGFFFCFLFPKQADIAKLSQILTNLILS